MTMNKKIGLFGAFACLCALVLVLAGCGGSSSSASADSSSASADSSTESSDASSEEATSSWYSSATANDKGYKLVEDGYLTGVSDMSYPPLESVVKGSSDEYEGFEIDLVTEVANRLGLKVKWLNPMKFDTIIPTIKQGGRADIGVSSFTINDERKEEIDFSEAYIDSNQSIVMMKDSPNMVTTEAKALETLNKDDVTICVQQGTTGEDWVKENLPKAHCEPHDNADECLNQLVAGKCTAVVADLPCMAYYCTYNFTDCEVAVKVPTGEQYGIVVSKENAKLTEDINKALKEMTEDGTIDGLMDKWFGDFELEA